MKRYFGCLLVIMAIVCVFINVSFAAGKIVESPAIKTFISGKQVKFSSAAVTVNGEVLLNYKDLLVKLGIPNDTKHIILDKSKKNLTIVNGKTKIIMTANAAKAKVNNAAKTLNTAPVLYKNQYYIPVKATVQLLGKKYAWDDTEKSIYIQNTSDYNKVKAILDKAVKSTVAVNRYIVETSLDSSSKSSGDTFISKIKTVSKIDKKNMQMTIDSKFQDAVSGDETGFYYIYNGYLYSKYSFSDKWEKQLLTKEDYEDMIKQFDISEFEITDTLYCGLTIEEKPKENKINLKGNVYLHIKGDKNDIEPVSTYLEISINKSKGLIIGVTHKHTEYQNYSESEDRSLDSSTESYTFRDFNGNFIIEVPDESKMEFEEESEGTGDNYEPVDIGQGEQAKLDGLKSKVEKLPVDGAWANPYNLDITEAIMFIVLKNQDDLDTFMELSDDAKKAFINDIIQDNYGDYLGCETVYGFVVYDSKAYASVTTGYETAAEVIELQDYSDTPAEIDVVKQDKKTNTYETYGSK
jgi:hypothetical protein